MSLEAWCNRSMKIIESVVINCVSCPVRPLTVGAPFGFVTTIALEYTYFHLWFRFTVGFSEKRGGGTVKAIDPNMTMKLNTATRTRSRSQRPIENFAIDECR